MVDDAIQHNRTADGAVKGKARIRYLLGLTAQLPDRGRESRQRGRCGHRCVFRSGVTQSALLPSYGDTSTVGSLGSTVVSRFPATMDPSDSRRGPTSVMSSRPRLRTSPSPRRVSQVPRSICPHALSPFTPGGPMAAFARCFATGGGLHHSPAGWPSSTCVTRPIRVRLRYGSRVRSAGLRRGRSLRSPPASLPAERAISRAASFQATRSTRLILAHQMNTDRPWA